MIQHIRLHFFRISDKFMSFYYNIRVAYLQKKKYIYISTFINVIFFGDGKFVFLFNKRELSSFKRV